MSIDDDLRIYRQQTWNWIKRCPAPGDISNITPTKFQSGLCDINYVNAKGEVIGGGEGVGDSVLFSSILYFSGETWAAESVKRSQGDDGSMWRAPQRVNRDTEPTFSRDHLLGAMLYMVTLKNRGHGEEAANFGNKLWDWVASKRRQELQKALNEVSSISIFNDLIKDPRKTLDTIIGGAVPSRYRICNGEDGYCSISLSPYGHWGRLMLEVWRYVGAQTSISKSISRDISIPNPIPGFPDIFSDTVSIAIDFDLGEYSSLDYNTLFDINNAGVIAGELVGRDRSFLEHLSVCTALLLKAMGKSNQSSDSAVATIAKSNPNPFYLWAAGRSDDAKNKILEIFPSSEPVDKTQWAWERSYADAAWNQSFGWDFIAVINLLLGDTEPELNPIS
jgi:hypothetical protein